MIDNENMNLYEVLDISPDATPQEIRAAYLRTKAAYTKDSLALYTLVRPEETETYLAQVEEAYRVLSNPEKRKEYDRHYGQIDLDVTALPDNVVSIDRVPPMESAAEDDLLIPPSTDFATEKKTAAPAPVTAPIMRSVSPFDDAPAETQAPVFEVETREVSRSFSKAGIHAARSQALAGSDSLELSKEISEESEWKGSFLRKIREARRVSIEEIAEFTKVKRQYVDAIENEEFERLPAPVFVRGFIIQIAKMLRLPHDKVSTAFMARYQLAKRSKAG